MLVTGHDIIFFWVARMIMMTLKFTGEVPFRKCYIHGLVRDAEGRKMSKTKGNGLDPLDLIDGISLEELVEKRTANLTQPQMAPRIAKQTRKEFPDGIPSYGTDALRFTFSALATSGRDVNLDLNRVAGYRNFCNKLWNAARFVLMNCRDREVAGDAERSLADRWIASRTHRLLADSRRAIETYRFDLYAAAVYDFVWHEYCDWYLELTKPLLWNADTRPAVLRGTRQTLLTVLETLLRAAHPVMPFITEAIWREVAPLLGNQRPTIMLEPYPEAADFTADPDADAAVEWLKRVVLGVRNIRGEADIRPSQTVDVLFQGGSATDRELAAATGELFRRLAAIDSVTWLGDDDDAPASALALVGDLKVMVPLAGLIDLDAERARLEKEVGRKQQDVERINGKLGNASFVEKAPAAVVEKERQKLEAARAALATLREQLALIQGA